MSLLPVVLVDEDPSISRQKVDFQVIPATFDLKFEAKYVGIKIEKMDSSLKTSMFGQLRLAR